MLFEFENRKTEKRRKKYDRRAHKLKIQKKDGRRAPKEKVKKKDGRRAQKQKNKRNHKNMLKLNVRS